MLTDHMEIPVTDPDVPLFLGARDNGQLNMSPK